MAYGNDPSGVKNEKRQYYLKNSPQTTPAPKVEFDFFSFINKLKGKEKLSDKRLILQANISYIKGNSQYLKDVMDIFHGHPDYKTLEEIYRKLTHAH